MNFPDGNERSEHDEEWHVCRILIRLALECDNNCIERWTENGDTLLYSSMSREQAVMRLLASCGIVSEDGAGVRFRLLQTDFNRAADALRASGDFKRVLSAVVSETCDNGLLPDDRKPFELAFPAHVKPEVRSEIARLVHNLIGLNCLAVVNGDDGARRFRWTDRMIQPMHDNWLWGGAPADEH